MSGKSRYLKSIGTSTVSPYTDSLREPPPPPPPKSKRVSGTTQRDIYEDLSQSLSGSLGSVISNPPPPPPRRDFEKNRNVGLDDLQPRESKRTPTWSRYKFNPETKEQNSVGSSFDEVLNNSQSNDSIHSEGKESVAARRRRKAQEASYGVKQNRTNSTHYSKTNIKSRSDDVDKVDSPLVLYDSDEKSTDFEDEEGAVLSVNGDSQKSKGFFKVKSFIRMGTGRRSPVRNRSKSPQRTTYLDGDIHSGQRSAEIVVDQVKLAESASKLNRSPLWQSKDEAPNSFTKSQELAEDEGRNRNSQRQTLPSRNLGDKFRMNGGTALTSLRSDDVSELSNPTFFNTQSGIHLSSNNREEVARQEFVMKNAIPMKMKERSGTPSGSESSMDQSESAAPLISTKVLDPRHETDEEKAAKYHHSRSKTKESSFEPSMFGSETVVDEDPFFSPEGLDSKDPFKHPFYSGIGSASEHQKNSTTPTMDEFAYGADEAQISYDNRHSARTETINSDRRNLVDYGAEHRQRQSQNKYAPNNLSHEIQLTDSTYSSRSESPTPRPGSVSPKWKKERKKEQSLNIRIDTATNEIDSIESPRTMSPIYETQIRSSGDGSGGYGYQEEVDITDSSHSTPVTSPSNSERLANSPTNSKYPSQKFHYENEAVLSRRGSNEIDSASRSFRHKGSHSQSNQYLKTEKSVRFENDYNYEEEPLEVRSNYESRVERSESDSYRRENTEDVNLRNSRQSKIQASAHNDERHTERREYNHNRTQIINEKGPSGSIHSPQLAASDSGIVRSYGRQRSIHHSSSIDKVDAETTVDGEEKEAYHHNKSKFKSNDVNMAKSSQKYDQKSNIGRSARAAARRNKLEQKAKDELIKYSTNGTGSTRGSLKGHTSSSNQLANHGQLQPNRRMRSHVGTSTLKRGLSPVRVLSHRGDQTSFLKKAPAQLIPKRKPFKAPTGVFSSNEAAVAYTSEMTDPIQRAGVRLLSAAAVPIQTEIRRFIAKRRAEDRIWALTVIQSYFRMWKAETIRFETLYCVTKIQACFRGWLLRDTLEDEHFCATEIQKIARGYLATMQVYEDLYNITVVQSIARRKAAIVKAKIRLNSILTIQSFYRGMRWRRELAIQHNCSTTIQSAWRGYSAQVTYQFDIVDIIIVQSIFRRRSAQRLHASIIHKKHTEAAVVIQTCWRTYDCTMTYLHSIADILIVQSVVRRWIAMRFVPLYRAEVHNRNAVTIQTVSRGWSARMMLKKMKASIQIQSAWRGFQCYIDYIFTMADIVIVQRTVRQWLAVRHVNAIRKRIKKDNYNAAATRIQKIWRGYHAHMAMLFTLVHIIVVQSVARRRLAIARFKPVRLEHRSAIILQSQYRGYMVRNDYIEYLAARKIQACFRRTLARNIYIEYQAARCIQAQARRIIAVKNFKEYRAARAIQCWYRCQSISRDYSVFVAARKIQAQWRGFEARRVVGDELWLRDDAATSIQKTWRMFYQFSNYTILSFEKHAATTIQRCWRGFWQSSHYVILQFEIVRIQAFLRGNHQRKKLKQQNDSARVIQSTARRFMARKNCHMERLIAAMVWSASTSLSTRLASKRIQRWYREKRTKSEQKKAALIIERFFLWVRTEVEEEIERREKMKLVKRQKQRRRRRDEEDTLLESVWNTTLDDNTVQEQKKDKRKKDKTKGRQNRDSRSKKGSEHEEGRRKEATKQKSSSRSKENQHGGRRIEKEQKQSVRNRFGFYDPNEVEVQRPPTATVNMANDYSDTHSEVSGITTPSIFVGPISRVKMKSQDVEDDLDLEEAWMDTSQVKRSVDIGKKKKIMSRMQRNHSRDSSKENGDVSNRLDSVQADKNRIVPLDSSRRVHRDIMRRAL